MDKIFGQQVHAQIPPVVHGIVMTFFQIAIPTSIGLTAGCIPIVGYHIGAKQKDRTRQHFTDLLITKAVIGMIAFHC